MDPGGKSGEMREGNTQRTNQFEGTDQEKGLGGLRDGSTWHGEISPVSVPCTLNRLSGAGERVWQGKRSQFWLRDTG